MNVFDQKKWSSSSQKDDISSHAMCEKMTATSAMQLPGDVRTNMSPDASLPGGVNLCKKTDPKGVKHLFST